MQANFPTGLAFVWGPRRDSPTDGYHVTPHDPGLGTKGGVTEDTWRAACRAGVTAGPLLSASDDALSAVLRWDAWGTVCDDLPHGLDVLAFNGIMMTGAYRKIIQVALGFTGDDVDGDIGPLTQSAMAARDYATLIHAITGVHAQYLRELDTFAEFGAGWMTRLLGARDLALQMVGGRLVVLSSANLPAAQTESGDRRVPRESDTLGLD